MNEYKIWEEYPEVWSTKSKFWSWLRGRLREAVWSNQAVKTSFIESKKIRIPGAREGTTRWGIRCEICNGEFPMNQTKGGKSKINYNVDHKVGEISLKEWEDVVPFILHLIPKHNDLQMLCRECHKQKTTSERYGITLEEAAVKGHLSSFTKLDEVGQRALLSAHGCEDIPKTKKDRIEVYRRILNESNGRN